MASNVQDQAQTISTFTKRTALLASIPIAVGFGAQWLLPSSVSLILGVVLLGGGVATSVGNAPHIAPTRKDFVSTLLCVTGVFLLINQLTFRLLPGVALIAGVVMLAKWPLIVRKNPAAMSMRKEYFLSVIVTMTLGIPLYIAEAGMDWNRPVLSCFALLPLAGWAIAIGINSVRVMRVTPVPDGVDDDLFRAQFAQIERMGADFLASMQFALVPIAAMGLVAGTMYYASVQVGAGLAAVLILVSLELLVRQRDTWSDRRMIVAVGVLVGCLSTLGIPTDSVAVNAVVFVASGALSTDAILAAMKRPTGWNVVRVRNASDALMFLIAPSAAITASLVRLTGAV